MVDLVRSGRTPSFRTDRDELRGFFTQIFNTCDYVCRPALARFSSSVAVPGAGAGNIRNRRYFPVQHGFGEGLLTTRGGDSMVPAGPPANGWATIFWHTDRMPDDDRFFSPRPDPERIDLAAIKTGIEFVLEQLSQLHKQLALTALGTIFCTAAFTTLLDRWLLAR
jgi:hypothetical protein